MNLTDLKVGDSFIIKETAHLSVASGFITKLPVNNNNIFKVIKVNKTTVEATSSSPLTNKRNKKTHLLSNSTTQDIGEVKVKI